MNLCVFGASSDDIDSDYITAVRRLGQAMAALCPGPLLCLDGVGVDNGDYMDIGAPVAGGTVLPVVIKTIAFHKS